MTDRKHRHDDAQTHARRGRRPRGRPDGRGRGPAKPYAAADAAGDAVAARTTWSRGSPPSATTTSTTCGACRPSSRTTASACGARADELRLRAGEDVVESLLPVVDNMGRALEAAAQHEEGQLVAGLQLVAGQLHDALVAHGLAEVPTAPGDPFDPTVHEAVMTQPSDDHDEGAVLQVLERGYLLHGRLLRPAKVVVAR